jgi:hypothetical protein
MSLSSNPKTDPGDLKSCPLTYSSSWKPTLGMINSELGGGEKKEVSGPGQPTELV